MKLKINDTYIDLKEVVAIGPLTSGSAHDGMGNRMTFNLWLRGQREPFRFTATEKLIDPYNLDSGENDVARVEARANHQTLITNWQTLQ